MLGVGKTGQVTFTSGYSSFKSAGEWADFNVTQTAIPFLIGYRANFNGFFIEPQIGYGAYSEKYPEDDGFGTDSGGAFTWAAWALDMCSTKKLSSVHATNPQVKKEAL